MFSSDGLAFSPVTGIYWIQTDDGAGKRPRSATIVITKNDGGRIGS